MKININKEEESKIVAESGVIVLLCGLIYLINT